MLSNYLTQGRLRTTSWAKKKWRPNLQSPWRPLLTLAESWNLALVFAHLQQGWHLRFGGVTGFQVGV